MSSFCRCANCQEYFTSTDSFDAGWMGKHGVGTAHRVQINGNRHEEAEKVLNEIISRAAIEAKQEEVIDVDVDEAAAPTLPTQQRERELDPSRSFIPCQQCGQRVQREYGQRRRHVYGRHSPAEVGPHRRAQQAALKRVMAECFPRERVLNDVTCHECFSEVPIRGSGKQPQVKHIQERHLEVELKCVVQGCSSVLTSVDHLRIHIGQVHSNISDLPGDLKTVYDGIKRRVGRESAAVYDRYFPSKPLTQALSRRNEEERAGEEGRRTS